MEWKLEFHSVSVVFERMKSTRDRERYELIKLIHLNCIRYRYFMDFASYFESFGSITSSLVDF